MSIIISPEEKIKQLEEALRQSKSSLNAIFSFVPITIFFLDRNGIFTELSGNNLNILGLKTEEVIGRSIYDVYRDLPELLTNIQLALRGKEFRSIIQIAEHTLEICYFPKYDLNNQVHEVICLATDITDQKRALNAFFESEIRLRSIITSAPIVLFSLDPQGRFTFLEGKFLKNLNLYPNDVLGRSIYDVYSNHPQIVADAQRALNGENFTSITQLQNSVFDLRYSSLFDSEHKFIGVIGVAIDITPRKRAEEELWDEKERLSVTLNSIGDGVITTNVDGKILFMNKAAEILLEWPQNKIFNKPFNKIFRLIDRKNKKRYQNLVSDIVKKGQIREIDSPTILLTYQKKERLIVGSLAPIKNTNGSIIGVVIAFRDITELEKITDELLKSSKLQSLALLAGGIAHDFNNILTAIVGNISLAKIFQNNPEKIISRLNEAEKACDRARDLTQQLLTFAKGGAPVKQTSRVSDIISDSVQFALHGSNIQSEISLPENLWPIDVDKGQLSQVISNLAINARQSMIEGGVVKISARNISSLDLEISSLVPGKYIEIIVQDSGIGISPEHISKIFDPFFTTKKQGNGLGLATSYSIIKKHDGEIKVQSQINTGTIFYVYLPASIKMIDVKLIEKDSSITGQGRILVMDDEISIRNITKMMLEQLGYKTEIVSNGVEAVNAYKNAKNSNNPFVALILDLTIPGEVGGTETALILSKFDKNIKLIATSGYSDNFVMANFQEYGFSGTINKPYTVEELGKVLHQVIHNKSQN